MDSIRIIKKYPNRRLYDTTISKYITLDDVRELVINHVQFKIMDERTDEDVTNYVLLQIITEKENRTPFFTKEILLNIIRFYDNPLQKTMSEFLEKSFSSLSAGNMQGPLFNDLSDFTKKSMEVWQSAFKNYFNAEKSNTPKKSRRKKKPIK